MEKQAIISNGVSYELTVVKNFVEISQPSVPEIYVWYSKDSERYTMIFGEDVFYFIIDEYFSAHVTEENYKELPEFIHMWNEHRGWVDSDDLTGYKMETEDFLRSMELLISCEYSESLRNSAKALITALTALALDAQSEGLKLNIAIL
jgi:sulfur relay (sulfurtransferase) DsrF/TusC family protein